LLWTADFSIRAMADPVLLTEFHDLDADETIPEVIVVTTMD
jgi:hypothetical protein